MKSKQIKTHVSFLLALLLTFFQLNAQHSFTENKGQWPDNVLYKGEYAGAKVYLEKNGFTFDTYSIEEFDNWALNHAGPQLHENYSIQAHSFALRFKNASEQIKVIAKDKSQTYENFFVGDKSNWAVGAHNFRYLRYENVYTKIDIALQKQAGQFKYDWVIKPGGNIEDILFMYEGADRVKVKKGKLIIETRVKEFEEIIPLAYYQSASGFTSVRARYVKKADGIGFEILENYPADATLVIDPILIFSTFSGSNANNFGYTATFDSKGFLYSGSTAFGTGYPVVLGPYDMFQGGTTDIAISKYDTTGTFRVYSTYLGGSNNEMPHSIIVNSNDELFVYGTSGSNNFPIGPNAFQAENKGGPNVPLGGLGFNYDEGADIVVSRLSANGQELLASTFVGGTSSDGLNLAGQLAFNYADEVRGEILIDANDNIYVASSTQSSDFPTTENAYQSELAGNQDGVIFKMDNNLTSMVWSSYFGGTGADAFYAMDLDDNDNPIMCGGTTSNDLPFSNNAFQQSYAGETDGFLVKFENNGIELISMSYLGFENYDQIYFVELDSEGAPHVFGQTETGDNYSFNNLYSNPNSGQFLGILSEDLSSYDWGMCFGNGNGEPNISPTAFLVDVCNQIYLTGWGSGIQGGTLGTTGLPFTADAYQSTTDGSDFYIYITGTDLNAPAYASYFGGPISNEHVDGGTSRFDRTGKIYQAVCAGCGSNSDFPIFPADAVSSTNNGPAVTSCNLGVFKMDFEEDLVIADFDVNAVCWPDPVEFENFSFNATSYQWLFGDDNSSAQSDPSHLYDEPGLYEVSLVVSNPASCNFSDTITKEILVLSPDGFELEDLSICNGGSAQIGLEPFGDASIAYSWIPIDNLSDPTAPNPFFSGNENQTFTLSINNGLCSSQATQNIEVFTLDLMTSPDTVICAGGTALLNIDGQGIIDAVLWAETPSFNSVLSNDSTLAVSPILPTTYFVSADYLTCNAIDSVLVVPAEFSTQISEDFLLCNNETGILAALNLFPQFEISYDWSPDSEIISGDGTDEISINPSETTEYTLNLTNELGCSWQENVLVEVSELNYDSVAVSASQTVITNNESTTLFGQPGSPFDVSWSPSNGLGSPLSPSTSASPGNTTTYTYTVIDNSPLGSCISSDSITIFVEELVCGFPTVFLPNSFTPNGDGENDILFLRGEFVQSMSLKIYDRWGEKVFETDNQNIGWDGSYKGREADSAVYVYTLEVLCVDGQNLNDQGNITLIR